MVHLYKFIKKEKTKNLTKQFLLQLYKCEDGESAVGPRRNRKPEQKNSAGLLITSTPALPQMSFSIIYRAVCSSVRLNQS